MLFVVVVNVGGDGGCCEFYFSLSIYFLLKAKLLLVPKTAYFKLTA